tara:strand:+ start:916 stop:1554 length:639 start_codon:yes stop_codon:yes gene_type:complete
MAANEHKNLTDENRHNPKGFEDATNDTVLSKNEGTGSTLKDGNLVYINKTLLGVTNYKMQGYSTGTTNYAYGEDIADNKSPYQMDIDYGNSVVASGSLTPSAIFRVGQGHIIPEASNVNRVYGWVQSNGGNVVTIAICAVTPAAGVTTNLVPVVIDEIAVTGLSSNNKLVAINETTITRSTLAAGDILFPMIKEASAGSSLYFNLTIQTYTY